MVDFAGKFKSFADKAQQKITEIQNDEQLREKVSNVVKQAQEKLEEVKNDDRVKSLVDKGKGKIDEFYTNQKPSSEDGNYPLVNNIKLIEGSPSTNTSLGVIDLRSDSSQVQHGEKRFIPTTGQGLNHLFMSEVGIRGLSGIYPFCTNKIAFHFSEITLTAFTEEENDIIFTFHLINGNIQTIGFQCTQYMQHANHENILSFIINRAYAVTPDVNKILEQSKAKTEQAKISQCRLLDYIKSNQNKIVAQQNASYRGGYPGFPKSADKYGIAYILDESVAFIDDQVSWLVSHNKIIKAELDFFQVRGTRAFLGGANMTRTLQEVKNTVAVTYVDDENVERIIKFQIHGAATIPGEGVKAQEFLNQLLTFKGNFSQPLQKDSVNSIDPLETLKKLQELRQMGALSESEFDEKKQEILKRL
jgi:Short C-terminal domain